MNLTELQELVARGESENLEFKRTTGQRTAAMRTLCAMLNGTGGFVLFGVNDQGEIIGQDVSTETHEDLANEVRKIDPHVNPTSGTVTLENGKKVIVLTVGGSNGPYTYDGRPYHRIGPTTSMMPHQRYAEMVMEKMHGSRRWEREPVPSGVGIADLDGDEIQRTVNNAMDLGRLEMVRSRDLEFILRGLGLIADDHLLNAAVALYGADSRLQSLYPQLSIRMARFRGKDRLADFIDNRQYWANGFNAIYRAQSFLRDHVPIAGRVVPGELQREDQPLYPPRATREALANAICHRDYTVPGGAVAVAMYDDHLEIANPGGFHFGLTPEKLIQPHESRPWNPIIANVFYLTGIIEKWGTGTLNIHDWCREAGAPAPVWEEQSGSVVITFRPPIETLEIQPGKPAGERQEASLAERVLMILGDQALSRSELSSRLGQKQASGHLHIVIRTLLAQGAIEYTIPEKPSSPRQRYRRTVPGAGDR